MEIFKAGTIKSVKLTNFMCHDSFELAFGPGVNFVIGPNGSGKSALLTAIVVALGGRASTTSRAKKATDFIMYGKKFAKVTVVLHNYEKIMDKPKAYRPDEYGKFIIVEKIIQKDDVSKLIIKNDKDKKVSERKSELDNILEHFGILINNPICILNQEVSKTFLHSKKPEDKFELFMKATNLEQIENDYKTAELCHKEWDECNSKKSNAFKLLDHEYEKCKEQTYFIENRSRLSDKRTQLGRELIWSMIKEKESSRDELDIKLRDTEEKIAKIDKEISDRKKKITNFEQDIEIMRSTITSANEQVEETKKKYEDIRTKESNIKLKKVDITQKIEQWKRSLARLTSDRDSLEKSIADMKKQFKDQNALDQDNERRKLEIDRLEREIPLDKAKERSIRQHTEQLSNSMTDTRRELHKANMRVSEIKSQISQAQVTLRRLKNGQENRLRKYGDFVLKILEEIEKAHKAGKFKHKPVGPLGYHVKLKNPQVSAALEVHLGRNAHAFACDNHSDMATLSAIFKRVSANVENFRYPTIITRSFVGRHPVGRFKAVHNIYKTLLDYLEIEKDSVFNALVDRTSLETILFIPNYIDAENLMINPAQVPKNTRCAYTDDCSVMYPKTAHGGYRCIANNRSNLFLFAETDISNIKEKERDIELLNADLRDAENTAKLHNDSIKTQRQEYDDNNNEIRKILDTIRKKEEQLLNLKTTVTIEPQELHGLEAELDSVIRKCAEFKISVERETETLSTINGDLSDISKEKEECFKLIKIQEDKRSAIQTMIDKSKQSLNEAHLFIRQKTIINESAKKEKSEFESQISQELDKITRLSESVSNESRPNQIRAVKVVEEELKKIEVRLAAEQEDDRDPDELIECLKRRMKEIEGLKGLKDANLKNHDHSGRTLARRKTGFQSLRSNTCGSVSTTFATMLRTMNMNGRLSVYLDDCHENGEFRKGKTLEMQIDTNYQPTQRPNTVMSDNNNNSSGARRVSSSQPSSAIPPRAKRARTVQDNNEKENDNLRLTDTRSLSGGERSFSTVAFVLALWHHCPSPFKLMDEIDVFMDMVTRRHSYNALITYASAEDDPGQFIFLSPLDLPKIEKPDISVRIFEMPIIVRKRPHSQVQ